MSRSLIDRSPDLKRLRDVGYEVAVCEGYLVVRHVPYVNSAREVKFGTLVSTLALADDRTTAPDTHVIHFAGEYPSHKDGSPIEQLRHQTAPQSLAPELVVNHSFSNKPAQPFADYYEKVTSYVRVLSAPAEALDRSATACTFAPVPEGDEDRVFEYFDTNSSRAEINMISIKLAGLKIAIIGLGGTGTYVLDLVAKTRVAEIHLFDGDRFVQHNAFRSPGAASREELELTPYKTDHFKAIYSKMHRGLHSHPSYVDASNVADVRGMDFVFVCIDQAASKVLIFNHLEEAQTPFVDVGMGVLAVNGQLRGIVRTTSSTPSMRMHAASKIPQAEAAIDEYSTNVQIADLNMLNAALAVIKWKKLCGFYADLGGEHHCTYTIDLNMLLSDTRAA